MKNILVIITFLLFVSCGEQGPFTSENNTDLEILQKNIKTVEIDGCEYLVYQYSSGYNGYLAMTHKGNCKSSFH